MIRQLERELRKLDRRLVEEVIGLMRGISGV